VSTARASLRTVAGLVIAAAFLWLAFGRVDWHSLAAVAAEAQPGPIVLGLVALAAGFFVRIVRWWMMLRALEPDLPLRACVRPFLLSLAVNNTMPLRAGDIVRAVGFRDALRSPTMRVVGTLLIERVLDLFVLVALFFVGLLAIPDGVIPRAFITTAGFLGAGAVTAVLVLVFAPATMRRIVDRLAASNALAHRRVTPRLREAAHHLFDTFSLVQSPARALRLVALSLLAWVLEGSMYACVAWALHVGGSPIAPWFAAATGTLATLIPSSPGYVGTFDYFAILGLTAFGARRVIATAFAMIVHLILWLPVTLVGAAFFVAPRSIRTTAGSPRQSRQRSAA
jgi:glycosyltransferase 2 family protein